MRRARHRATTGGGTLSSRRFMVEKREAQTPRSWLLPLGRTGLHANLRRREPVLRNWLDLEPDGVQSRQEYERENRAAKGSADQGVRQRSPKHGLGEGDECQHGSERGQNDRPGALHGRLDDGIEWRQSLLLVLADLPDQNERIAHQDSGQRDQPDQRVNAERLMRGAVMSAVQELAGHRDLTMTQRYSHLSRTALADTIRLLENRAESPQNGDIVETREPATAT